MGRRFEPVGAHPPKSVKDQAKSYGRIGSYVVYLVGGIFAVEPFSNMDSDG